MVTIRDMIYVKNLERRLERPLQEDELNGEPFRARFPDGHVEFVAVPLLQFPDELLSIPGHAPMELPIEEAEAA